MEGGRWGANNISSFQVYQGETELQIEVLRPFFTFSFYLEVFLFFVARLVNAVN